MNVPRPIVAGGTGATTPAGACANIGAVNKTGDVMSGQLTVGSPTTDATLCINKPVSGTAAQLISTRNNVPRWSVILGDATAESGSNAGSDFEIKRYDDAGGFLGTPITIARSTGNVTFGYQLTSSTDNPVLTLNDTGGSAARNRVVGNRNGSPRWDMFLGDGTAEGGGNSGSNFVLERYADDGTFLGAPLTIARSTGNLVCNGQVAVSLDDPILTLNDTGGSSARNRIVGNRNGSPRWDIFLGDGMTEGGSNSGSNFIIERYNDGGSFIDAPLNISRASGQVSFSQQINVTPAAGTSPVLALNKANGASGVGNVLMGKTNGVSRWDLALGNGGPESGSNVGSDFAVNRYNDGGSYIDSPLVINRASGSMSVSAQAYKPGGGPWADSSDARIKNVIGDYTQGLDAVLALRPVRYTYKGNNTDAPTPAKAAAPYDGSPHQAAALKGTEFVGLLAQEAEIPMPEMVTSGPAYIDGVKVEDLRTLDTTALIYALINAVKTLNARIEVLEGR